MRRAIGVLLLVAALAGCSDGPQGPGAWTAIVRGPAPVGAAVLEVSGPGVEGFAPAGDSRVFGVPDAGSTTHRVVVISPTGNPLRFRIEVRDLADERPALVLVSATDVANQPLLSLQGYTIELSR